MLVLPVVSSGNVGAKTAFLSPSFEEGRVRMLGIPSRDSELDIVPWEEHWNPYATLMESHLFKDLSRRPRIMMDEEIRDYIVRGLDSAGFETVGLNPAVELVRQTKSAAEVELLRAVNTGTVEAVRAMRPCLVPGLTEGTYTDGCPHWSSQVFLWRRAGASFGRANPHPVKSFGCGNACCRDC